MTEMTFACPACDQHIQCEKRYGGHVIHCPKCCAELRIPFSNAGIPTELTVAKAELILGPAAATVPPVTADHHGPEDVRCLCPVCQSLLWLSAEAAGASGKDPPTAELICKAPEHAAAPPPPADKSEAPPVKSDSPAPSEREQQIAAAREANQVSLYPPMKPRLSYILNGEKPGGSAGDPAPPPPAKVEPAKPADVLEPFAE